MEQRTVDDPSSSPVYSDDVLREANNPRLDAWLARTSTPLDLLALFTIWLTVVPIGDFHRIGESPNWWFAARIGLSFVYFVDITVRTSLAHRKLRYLARHPLSIVAVIIPLVRLLFSLRLLTAMFRKGNLIHFLFVSLILLLNFTLIVYGFEHRVSDANITTIGDAIWWSCVTVFTVGYGDFYPVTTGGRIFAVAIMGLGLLTAAVITAQIASSFMDQASARRDAAAAGSNGDPATESDAAMASVLREMQRSIGDRLDAIDARIHHVTGGSTAVEGDHT